MPELDDDLLRHALKVAREHGFAEMEIAVNGASFSATLEPRPRKKKIGASANGESEAAPRDLEIRATLVGFYREAKSPLEVGRQVAAGDVVAVISALGIANDVEATVDGEVVEVLVEPGQPVEFGQVLAKVRPQ
jgi:acetyl-CoA carboxylase biotin carboxyl carrier protein